MQRIEADLMIPGRGEPVPDAVVVLDGVTIAYAGPAASAPETPGASVVTAHAVMPGMWDCHAHLLGVRSMDLALLPQVPAPLRAARATADLRAALDAGITSVRETGGLGIYLARAVDEGVLEGPSIYAAGAVISTTGGHGDLHGYPLPWMHDVRGELRLADGPAECAKAVREQLRRNAKVIKVCASGRNGRELPLLGKVGYPSLAAIEAATATGPATLGPQAPRSGQLLAGYDADVL